MPCPPVPINPTAAQHLGKGTLYWFDFGSGPGKRPVLVVSRYRPGSNQVTIAPLTDLDNVQDAATNTMKYPYHARLDRGDCKGPLGLDIDSAVKLDQLYTIERDDLWEEWFIGEVSLVARARIDLALIYALDLETFMGELMKSALQEKMADYQQHFSRR